MITWNRKKDDETYFGHTSFEHAEMYLQEWFKLNREIRFCVFQFEQVSNLHIQMYVELRGKISWKQMKKLCNEFYPGAHVDPRFGTQDQATKYCTKEESRVFGPFKYGHQKQQGKRSDLCEIYEDLEEGFTVAEVLHTHKHNAMRIVHAIEKTAMALHGLLSIDHHILTKRELRKQYEQGKSIGELKELANTILWDFPKQTFPNGRDRKYYDLIPEVEDDETDTEEPIPYVDGNTNTSTSNID